MSSIRVKSVLFQLYSPFVTEKSLLSTLSADSTSPLPAYVQSLTEASQRTSQALGNDKSEQQEVQNWLNRIDKEGDAIAEDLRALNDHLTPLTFLTQTASPTSADYSLLGLLYPKFTSLSIKDQHSLPSLTRYLSQLTFLFSQATSSSSRSKSDEEQSPDLNIKVLEPTFEGMPKIVRTNPKKEKKSVSNEEGSKKGKEALSGSVASGKKAKASGGGGGATEALTPDPSMIDLRVGKIVKISRHPDADSLYLESVDFGEVEGPRTILSGLVKYVPIEEMENRMVIGVCNLKPVAMRGIKSFGMLLCASAGEADGGKEGGVEPVTPPEGSLIGDKVEVEGWEGKVPLELLNPKKKIFEAIQPSYLTTSDRVCAWKGAGPVGSADESVRERILKTSRGNLTSKRFAGATLS